MDIDFRNAKPEKPDILPEARPQAPSPPLPKRKRRFKTFLFTLLILLLLAGGAAAYWWRDKEAKADAKQQQNEITALQQKVSDLEKQKSDAATEETTSEEEAEKVLPTATALESIKASITSGNTAALEGHMASTVRVIIAASEGVGDRTPVQAIEDLEYLNNADDPWNFALPAATLDNYAAGDYAQYFPDDALVGKSADDYVVSFTFNDAGKISGIFMAANADLL